MSTRNLQQSQKHRFHRWNKILDHMHTSRLNNRTPKEEKEERCMVGQQWAEECDRPIPFLEWGGCVCVGLYPAIVADGVLPGTILRAGVFRYTCPNIRPDRPSGLKG